MLRSLPPAAAVRGALALAAALIALPAQARVTPPAVTVERAWMRPAPAGLPTSAAYFTVRNTGGLPTLWKLSPRPPLASLPCTRA